MSQRQSSGYSGAAVGFTFFASAMLIMVGVFHAIAGMVAIVNDEFYVVGQEYIFQFDATGWGWIHLLLGILVAVAGGFLLRGAVWARTVGVVIAGISAVVSFAWLPWYPFWSIVMIALAVTVIWALTVHGRDVTRA
jgi:hypothetical protein